MAVIDFSLVGNAIQVTVGAGLPIQYYTSPVVEPNTDGSKFTFTFARPYPEQPDIYPVLLTDIRISGSSTAPVSALAALTSFSSVFIKANSSSGGTGVLTTVTTKTDDTAAFAALTNGQDAVFEVGGIIYRYSKNAAGATFKNYNQYP